jgi:hypothetical protein
LCCLSGRRQVKDLCGEAATVAYSNSGDHLRECCADAANRPLFDGLAIRVRLSPDRRGRKAWEVRFHLVEDEQDVLRREV